MGTDPSRAAIEAASVTQKVAAITRRSNRKPEKRKNKTKKLCCSTKDINWAESTQQTQSFENQE